jgi:hypothetical protein
MSRRNRQKKERNKMSSTNERVINLQEPLACMGCGLITAEWYEQYQDIENHWLLLPLVQPGQGGNPFPGIGLFACPRCGTLAVNSNAKENNQTIKKWIKEDREKKIAIASGLVDPSGRPMELRTTP